MPINLSSTLDDVHVLLDRQSALDIAAFTVGGIDLSPGLAIPAGDDARINRALAGFLFTCGPEHIRHPEPVSGEEAGGTYPLHGSLCGTPVLSTTMADEGADGGCAAVTEVALADGGRARIDRHWSMGDGADGLCLTDRVSNIGGQDFGPMQMYHINISGRLCSPSTVLSGAMLEGGVLPWRFGDGERALICVDASATAIDGWASVTLGPLVGPEGVMLEVRFRTDTLPFLQVWRCQRGDADLISIEPASHRLALRAELEAGGELPAMAPGGDITYALAMQVHAVAGH